MAVRFGCNVIALSMSKDTGIPKTADERMELIFRMYEKFMEKGIESEKIFFDPLILPIGVDQYQACEIINTIKIIKESFEPKVNTIVGLSNISNGLSFDNKHYKSFYPKSSFGSMFLKIYLNKIFWNWFVISNI